MDNVYEFNQTGRERIIAEAQSSDVVTHITTDGGIKIHITNHPFPQKSCPTPEALIAINTVKRVLISFLSARLLPVSKIHLVKTFNRITWDVMEQHILKPEYMTDVSREMRSLIFVFLKNWGVEEGEATRTAKILSHVLEYDSAYRYRFQDIIGETNPEALLRRKEWIRLAQILYERDDLQTRGSERRVGTQFLRAIKLASLAFYLPGFKKALAVALRLPTWNLMLMDDSDKYWVSFRKDYKFNLSA